MLLGYTAASKDGILQALKQGDEADAIWYFIHHYSASLLV
jgi:hypothetical protein